MTEEENCAICQESLCDNENSKLIRVFNCKHKFHQYCINKGYPLFACPVCRKTLNKDFLCKKCFKPLGDDPCYKLENRDHFYCGLCAINKLTRKYREESQTKKNLYKNITIVENIYKRFLSDLEDGSISINDGWPAFKMELQAFFMSSDTMF